ncbi:MAG: hypothetical protein FWG99_06955 [Treponema sp.]|nr:hypothetical protein [Treponema sp.]
MKNTAFTFILMLFCTLGVYAQDNAGKHRGAVTALVHNGAEILSAGEDGFLGVWNVRERAAKTRFQLTTYRITYMIKNPQKDEICIIEYGGIDLYRISVWNYQTLKKIFSLESNSPISYVNYSAAGSFIIASGYNGENLTLIDSLTGDLLPFGESLTAAAVFAATGRAERNMLVYQPRGEGLSGGFISYRDMETGRQTSGFDAPAGMYSLIAFGNNRFLAGFNSGGLLVFDASSGAVLGTNRQIGRDALLCPAGNEFYAADRSTGELFLFSIDRAGNLVTNSRTQLIEDDFFRFRDISVIACNATTVFSTLDGGLWLLERGGRLFELAHQQQEKIVEIAVSGTSIAFHTENGELGFLPLDYGNLGGNTTITLENQENYSQITSLSPSDSGAGRFLLWQNNNTRILPKVLNPTLQNDLSEEVLYSGQIMDAMPLRFPLRKAASNNGMILFLDAAGNISLHETADNGRNRLFSFSSVGAMDSVFINGETFILCRSVVSPNSPFVIVNIKTGETVPVLMPSLAGITAYRGDSDNIYIAVAEQDAGGIKTSVLNLNFYSPVQSDRLFETRGEDTQVSIAESGGRVASSLGADGAAIYTEEGLIYFERTPGIPVKLTGWRDCFICLDSEGNIAWHNSQNGRILAVFSLYQHTWVLQIENGRKEGSVVPD